MRATPHPEFRGRQSAPEDLSFTTERRTNNRHDLWAMMRGAGARRSTFYVPQSSIVDGANERTVLTSERRGYRQSERRPSKVQEPEERLRGTGTNNIIVVEPAGGYLPVSSKWGSRRELE